jgi:2'-hydroxyisoflavone reductase
VAIDTCGYVPRLVRDSVELLNGAVEQYIFISTISVYADFANSNMDESAPLATMEDETIEEITGETYGALKVLCEKAVDEGINGRVLHIRPGFIVGPHDMTDRYSYYAHRIAQGGSVLLPQSPDWPMQVIDARDLAEWTILAAEQQLTGIYNVTGPDYPLSFGEVVETCQAVSESAATFTYLPESFLQKNDAENAFPLWAGDGDAGIHTINSQKAIAAGLTFRPLAETVRDTLDYLDTLPADREWKVGLRHEQEAELLAKWRTQNH